MQVKNENFAEQTCHHEAFRILDDEMPDKDAEVYEGEGGTGVHKVNTETPMILFSL
jgi:hypothetical protein